MDAVTGWHTKRWPGFFYNLLRSGGRNTLVVYKTSSADDHSFQADWFRLKTDTNLSIYLMIFCHYITWTQVICCHYITPNLIENTYKFVYSKAFDRQGNV